MVNLLGENGEQDHFEELPRQERRQKKQKKKKKMMKKKKKQCMV